MSVLSDSSIEELCLGNPLLPLITPYSRDCLQPASYDLHLNLVRPETLPVRSLYAVQAGEFVLASTIETVNVPPYLVGRMEGKSSLARRGLIVHTAGFVDPGFRGQLTLEITNLSRRPIELTAGMRIAQISFSGLDRPPERLYGHPELGSHYQHQEGPTPAKQ